MTNKDNLKQIARLIYHQPTFKILFYGKDKLWCKNLIFCNPYTNYMCVNMPDNGVSLVDYKVYNTKTKRMNKVFLLDRVLYNQAKNEYKNRWGYPKGQYAGVINTWQDYLKNYKGER